MPTPGMEKLAYLNDNLESVDLVMDHADLDSPGSRLSGMRFQGASLDDGLLSMSES